MQPPKPLSVQNNELDNVDLFFASLAKTVKKLPQYEQARLKMSIGNLVFQAELNYTSPIIQPQVITVTMPQPLPVLTFSTNSYSHDSGSLQSPSTDHFLPHIEDDATSNVPISLLNL